jgi:hypothetical protein
MGILQKLGNGQGYLKAGLLGFAGAGKTMTATKIAVGTRAFFKEDGPIAMFDTEGGSEYIAEIVRSATGKDMVGVKSRSLDDLLEVGQECVKSGVSVLIVDSMTHVWRDVVDSYLAEVNRQRAGRNQGPRKTLEFQDWGPIKAKFGQWTDFYLNSKLHIIIAGRAGWDYEEEKNEQGKKQLVKSGTKMKTESEFGFEPSLLIEMEMIDERSGGKKSGVVSRMATVIKDRFAVIDGKQFKNPKFEDFLPHIERLKPGAHTDIDMSLKTTHDVDETGDAQYYRERKTREILCEEIQGELTAAFPGQSADEKKIKVDLIFNAFNTRSWTAVQSTDSEKLRAGLKAIREAIALKNRLEKGIEAGATDQAKA